MSEDKKTEILAQKRGFNIMNYQGVKMTAGWSSEWSSDDKKSPSSVMTEMMEYLRGWWNCHLDDT
jgi:hypothetical protein